MQEWEQLILFVGKVNFTFILFNVFKIFYSEYEF